MTPLRQGFGEQARVLMVGGGSAGHVAPMVAVAQALRKIEPSILVTFVCSDRPSDGAFLAMEGESFHTLPLPRRGASLPLTLLRGFAKSRRILRTEKPDVIFSKGGAVSVALCAAAYARGIPIVLHESDAVMGHANRIVSGFFGGVVVRGTEVGNPIRERVTSGKKEEGLRIAGLDDTKPVLLVMGGSQGAQAINDAVTRHLDELLAFAHVIHLTGPGKKTAQNRPGYHATEFGSDVLPHFYAAADLAVSRAGAGSIAELSACGVPMILVPIRGLAGDHQVKNAERAREEGRATVLPQERLDTDLVPFVRDALSQSVRNQTEPDSGRYAPPKEAARLVAETVLQSVAR